MLCMKLWHKKVRMYVDMWCNKTWKWCSEEITKLHIDYCDDVAVQSLDSVLSKCLKPEMEAKLWRNNQVSHLQPPESSPRGWGWEGWWCFSCSCWRTRWGRRGCCRRIRWGWWCWRGWAQGPGPLSPASSAPPPRPRRKGPAPARGVNDPSRISQFPEKAPLEPSLLCKCLLLL